LLKLNVKFYMYVHCNMNVKHSVILEWKDAFIVWAVCSWTNYNRVAKNSLAFENWYSSHVSITVGTELNVRVCVCGTSVMSWYSIPYAVFFSLKFERLIKSVGVVMIVVNTSIRLSVMFSYCSVDHHNNILLSKLAWAIVLSMYVCEVLGLYFCWDTHLLWLRVFVVLFSVLNCTMTISSAEVLTVMLTLRLLMLCIYMELLVKPEMLTSYIYGPTFGNAETVFLFAAQCFDTESMQRGFLCHICV